MLFLDPGWVKIRIRDKHPRSATLFEIMDLDPQNQCYGSGMFIPDPGSWFLLIPDPGSKNSKKRGLKKFFWVKPFFVATNFTELKIILFYKYWRKKFGQVFKDLNFLTKNLSPSSKKYGVGILDPRSGIGEKTYSGSRIRVQGQKGTGSRIRNTAHNWRKTVKFSQIYFEVVQFVVYYIHTVRVPDPNPDPYVCGPSGSGPVIICSDQVLDPDPPIIKQKSKKHIGFNGCVSSLWLV